MAKVKGLKTVLKKLDRLGKEAERDVHDITGDIATQISLNAKNNAPTDTGKLKQGIDSVELGRSSFEVITNSDNIAPYSVYVEFGTVKMSAQPYLYPAYYKGIKQYKKDLNKLLNRLTKKNG